MRAVLFGSIGSVVETSEIQRAAFNRAFEDHGLRWTWDRETYRDLLATSGGAARIESFAVARGESVDAGAIHRSKTERFLEMLEAEALAFRPGVTASLAMAKRAGLKTGFVTSTERATVARIVAAMRDAGIAEVDVTTHRGMGADDKPGPGVYLHALDALNIRPAEALAIEDNADGVTAARAAGIWTMAYPGANTRHADIAHADAVVTQDLAEAVGDRIGAAPQAAE